MRVAHEAPLSIIRRVRALTDYDYALVHLFEESSEYYEFFKDSLRRGRYVILDNSIFELGEAFDTDKFAQYVNELRPSAYIIPDSLENKDKTIENFESWKDVYYDMPGEKIGVVQGKTYDEIVECYEYMKQNADKIAISFDYSYYEKEFPHSDHRFFEKNKYFSWMIGRQKLLSRMLADSIIDTNKPHHLLGCALPQEFAYYKLWKWIDTIDTSNPVLHGLQGIKYERQPQYDLYGLDTKSNTKMFTLLDEDVAKLDDILYNIKMFRHNISLR